jgi:hypothetical protein
MYCRYARERGIERQERRQWAIGDADKVIDKVDLQAAALTCSQGTRDLLSHGVLPYGASLVKAGVASSPEPAEFLFLFVRFPCSSRAASTPRPRTVYASTLRHRVGMHPWYSTRYC